MRQSLIAFVHVLAGCIAFALALYFLLSDALSFEFPSEHLAQRPRIMVTACFGFAGYCLLSSARQGHRKAPKVLGYGSAGLGLAIVWLIFSGMDISAP